MPKKFQVPMDSSPDHAAAIGRMVAQWAMLEWLITDILRMLLDTDQYRAKIIFQNFVSFRAKLTLVERLVYAFVSDTPERNELLGLTEVAGTLNTDRNKLVHATWAAGKSGNLTLIPGSLPWNPSKHRKPTEPMTAQNIQDVADKIGELTLKIQNFLYLGDAEKLVIAQRPLN